VHLGGVRAAQGEGPVGQRLRDPGGGPEGIPSLEDLEPLGGLGLPVDLDGQGAGLRSVPVDPAKNLDLFFPELFQREIPAGGAPPEAQLPPDRWDSHRGQPIRLLRVHAATKNGADEATGELDAALCLRGLPDKLSGGGPGPHAGLPMPIAASPKPSRRSCSSSPMFCIQRSSTHRHRVCSSPDSCTQ